MQDHTSDNSAAFDAFMTVKAAIDTMLARLQALSADNFKISPDDVKWSHVWTLGCYANQLQRITDAALKEENHAYDLPALQP